MSEEKYWRKAISIVNRDYPEVPKGSAQWWSLVLGIYKRMQGRNPIRPLQSAKIIKKADAEINPLPVIALLSILEPMVGSMMPISVSQLLMDLPPPPTLADFSLVAPHYSNMFPHLAQPRSPNIIKEEYLSKPVFLPLEHEEILLLSRGVPITLGKGLAEDAEWVKVFNLAWYLGILVAMFKGLIAPRSETSLRWVFQIATNPFYRQSFHDMFINAWRGLEKNYHLLMGKTWGDCLTLRHRLATFRWVPPATGVYLSPSKIQYIWCIPSTLLQKPLLPPLENADQLGSWFVETLQNFRPYMSNISSIDDGYVPFVGGKIEDLGRECLAVLLFSDWGLNLPVPIIKLDFDSKEEDVRWLLTQVLARKEQ